MNYLIGTAAFLFALISFVFVPMIVDSFHETIVEPQIDSGNVTTVVADTTGTLTLTTPLYMDRLSSVLDLESSLGGDAPAASAYTAATQVLEISGLVADSSRFLTVEYEYDSTTAFANSGAVIRVGPAVIILALIVMVIGIPGGMFYLIYRKARGR